MLLFLSNDQPNTKQNNRITLQDSIEVTVPTFTHTLNKITNMSINKIENMLIKFRSKSQKNKYI
jgi:hypothetical protein